MSRWQDARSRARAWVVDHAPLPLLTNAHEVGISVALMLVALPLLGGAEGPPSIHQKVEPWMAIGWAWTLVASGFLTLWGLFGHRPRLEWAGQLFAGWGLSFYALALVLATGRQGFLASAIFGVLGLVSWWRAWKITNAPLVQARLVKAARAAHQWLHAARTIERGRP